MSENEQACCRPNRKETEQRPSRTQERTELTEPTNWRQTEPATPQNDRTTGMVHLEGGEFTMDTDSDVGNSYITHSVYHEHFPVSRSGHRVRAFLRTGLAGYRRISRDKHYQSRVLTSTDERLG